MNRAWIAWGSVGTGTVMGVQSSGASGRAAGGKGTMPLWSFVPVFEHLGGMHVLEVLELPSGRCALRS